MNKSALFEKKQMQSVKIDESTFTRILSLRRISGAQSTKKPRWKLLNRTSKNGQ